MRSESCATTNDEEGDDKGCKHEGCTTHVYQGETFNIDPSTKDPGCDDDQYAYVMGINIARTDSTSFYSYTTTPELGSNDVGSALRPASPAEMIFRSDAARGD